MIQLQGHFQDIKTNIERFFWTVCCSPVTDRHVFDTTMQHCGPGAAPKAPDNQALNNSPDLSGHTATPPLPPPPLSLPDETLTI